MYILDSKHLYFLIYIGVIIACFYVNHSNRQLLPHYFKNFQYLFIVIIIFETLGEILKYNKINNYFLDHLYQPIELTILSIIYKNAVKSYSFRKLIIPIIIIFWIVALSYSLLVEGIQNENKFSFFLGGFTMIFYSYRYIFELYTLPPEKVNLLSISFFWIVTANLFYYYGIYFYMGLINFITDEAMIDKLRIINMALNYALYILYLIGFSCQKIFKYTY